LIRTDTLWESVIILLSRNPLNALLLVFWCVKGRSHLKRQLAQRVKLDPEALPYNQEFLAYLREQRGQGRTLLLVTAADRDVADRIALHTQIFSEVIASDGLRNLKGEHKRRALEERFGPGRFDYAGDSHADLAIWKTCNRSILVNASQGVCREAGTCSTVARSFARPKFRLKTLVRAIRSHQWVKNALVFLPVVTSHRVFDPVVMAQAALAAIAFSLCASSVYVLNDLIDLASDRAHERKRRRPFAAGDLSIPFGLALMSGLLLACIAMSIWLSLAFQLTIAIYYGCTLAYSLALKRRLLIDVFMLAGLYTIRVLAGSAATAIEPSAWLLAFCLFFFLSMALVKRFTELRASSKPSHQRLAGRGYSGVDTDAIGSLGSSAGFMCVLVLALYINSPQVAPLYRSPWALWFLCPLLMYWISRVWIMAYRGSMHDDPILFALRDRVSYITAGCCAIVMAAAAHGIRLPVK
jgi:4-hydroxybenzoate polyprenyltransferase